MNLAQALLAAQQEAPVLQRSAINPHFRSKFVPLDGLMEAILPVLNRNGLVLSQFPTMVVTSDGPVPSLKTRITHAESGETVEETMPLMLAKEDPQGQGSAITYARRYALMAILGLVADVDDDANAASKRSGAGPEPAPSPQSGQGQNGESTGAPSVDSAAASPPAPETFKAPTGPRGGKADAAETKAYADELRRLVGLLKATDSLPKIAEKEEAGDAAWLKRQIATAKKQVDKDLENSPFI